MPKGIYTVSIDTEIAEAIKTRGFALSTLINKLLTEWVQLQMGGYESVPTDKLRAKAEQLEAEKRWAQSEMDTVKDILNARTVDETKQQAQVKEFDAIVQEQRTRYEKYDMNQLVVMLNHLTSQEGSKYMPHIEALKQLIKEWKEAHPESDCLVK